MNQSNIIHPSMILIITINQGIRVRVCLCVVRVHSVLLISTHLNDSKHDADTNMHHKHVHACVFVCVSSYSFEAKKKGWAFVSFNSLLWSLLVGLLQSHRLHQCHRRCHHRRLRRRLLRRLHRQVLRWQDRQ